MNPQNVQFSLAVAIVLLVRSLLYNPTLQIAVTRVLS